MLLKQLSISQYIQTCLSLPAIMTTSAPPKRSTSADPNDPEHPRSQRSRKTISQKSSKTDSSQPKAKRRRLNDDTTAPGLRHPHKSFGPRHTDASARNQSQPATASGPSAPSSSSTNRREDVRSLRSQDAARPKSDLDKYFPDFEDVIRGETAEEGACFSTERCFDST